MKNFNQNKEQRGLFHGPESTLWFRFPSRNKSFVLFTWEILLAEQDLEQNLHITGSSWQTLLSRSEWCSAGSCFHLNLCVQLLCWSQRLSLVLLLCSHCGGITQIHAEEWVDITADLWNASASPLPLGMYFQQHRCAKAGCCAAGRTLGLERALVLDGMGFVAVTYHKLIIESSSSLGRAVGRLLPLRSFWCREQKIKQEWAETWVARGCTGLDIQPTLPGWFVRVQNLHGSQFPFPTSCFLGADLCQGGESLSSWHGLSLRYL